MIALDKLDKKLLVELDVDGRQSYATLGRKLRHGSDIIRYRIKRLQDAGLLNYVSTVVDLNRIGLTVYKTFLKLSGEEKKQQLIDYLNKHKSTYWLSEYYGSWDIQVSLATRNPSQFLEIHDSIQDKFSSSIRESSVATSVSVKRFPKNYIIERGLTMYHQGESQDLVSIDLLEKEILEALFLNARINIKELAKKIATTEAIVSYRIKKLEEQKVIIGYRAQVDYEILDVMLFKLLIFTENHNKAFEEAFHEYSREHLNITCVIRQIGSWTLECEIEVSSYNEIHSIIKEIKSQFSNNICSVDYLVLSKDHYHRFPNTCLIRS